MSHTDGPSTSQQIRNFISERGAATYQKIIEATDVGDYDDLPKFLTYSLSQPVFLRGVNLGVPGPQSGDSPVKKANNLLGNPEDAIPSSLQKKLGDDPGDTDIDDLDDLAKAVGPSNLSIGGPSNFEGELPGPDGSNDTMNAEDAMGTAKRVKSVIDANSSLIIVAFFILGAIGVSVGPLDFE